MNGSGSRNTHVSTVNGIDIYLESASGKFVAEVNGRLIRMASVKNLENRIAEMVGSPTYAILLGSAHMPTEPRMARVVGWDKRTGRMITEYGKVDRFAPPPLEYREDIMQDLQTLYDAWENAKNAFFDYVAELGQVEPGGDPRGRVVVGELAEDLP